MNYLALVIAIGLMAGGMWFSRELGTVQQWLYGAGMLALFGMASESVLGRPLRGEPGSRRIVLGAWTAGIMFVASGLWLAGIVPADWLVQATVVMAVAAGAYLIASKGAAAPEGRYAQYGRFLSNLLLYLLAFVLFALIYQTKERALFTASAIGVVALVASLELLRPGGEPSPDRKVAILSAIAALLVGESAWVLGYWPVGGLVGGALLLLGFYVLVGLLQCLRDNSLGRSTVLEYGAVGIVGFLAILIAVP